MTRLAIALSKPRYRALDETAARRAKIISALTNESLDSYGDKSRTAPTQAKTTGK